MNMEQRRRQQREAETRYRKKKRIKRCRPSESGVCPASIKIRNQFIVELNKQGLVQKQTAYYAEVSEYTVYYISSKHRKE
jgi:hypothetical protein